MAEKPSYTSNQLAQRDQKVMEAHEKEVDIWRNKYERMKKNFEGSEKLRFQERQLANKLATLLGYGDAPQAIFDLEELADDSNGISFRELKTRAEQVSNEIAEAEKLKQRLKDVEQDVKRLTAAKRELENKYDALRVVRERLDIQFKQEYKKWSGVRRWLFGDDEEAMSLVIKNGAEALHRKRRAIREHEPNAHMLGESEDYHAPEIPQAIPNDSTVDKENSLMPPAKKRRVSGQPSPTNTSSGHTPSATTPAGSPKARNTLLASITNMEPPSCSPTVFLDANSAAKAKSRPTSQGRVPLSFKPIEDVINVKHEPEEPSLTPCPVGGRNEDISPPESPVASQVVPTSSQQTEDDSQAITIPSAADQFGRTTLFRVPLPPPPAPGSVYWDRNSRTPLHPSLPSRPSFATTSTAVEPSSSRRPFSMQELLPPKTRLETPSSTPRTTVVDERAAQPSSKGKQRAVGAQHDEDATPVTSRTQGQKRMDDYSAFKGRGRYGKQDDAGPTINKLFEIAPEKNHGRDYQYDEVVRKKDDRRKMDGGDCECCREYYEGVGPLPARLQPPLWRSPSKSQSQTDFHSPSRRPCLNRATSRSPTRHHDTSLTRSVDRHPSSSITRNIHISTSSSASHRRRHSEIAEHKKAISRHRQNWERAKTPPGYWDIGFPDTQEVGNINEKAREMHQRKRDEVEREVATGSGRYRRR